MIQSYRDKRTRRFAEGGSLKAFEGFKRQAEKRLEILDAATSIQDLIALRSNRFEQLRGDRKGHCTIRINQQWGICFEWPGGAAGPINVEITDYH